jgi:uncharacterized protein YeaO (DUF488 family)
MGTERRNASPRVCFWLGISTPLVRHWQRWAALVAQGRILLVPISHEPRCKFAPAVRIPLSEIFRFTGAAPSRPQKTPTWPLCIYPPVEFSLRSSLVVDRLWPRGRKKTDLRLDAWEKDIAPSTELRKWFGHDPKRWLEFCTRYENELKNPKVQLTITQTIHAAQHLSAITLVYGAKDTQHNEAVKGYFQARRVLQIERSKSTHEPQQSAGNRHAILAQHPPGILEQL